MPTKSNNMAVSDPADTGFRSPDSPKSNSITRNGFKITTRKLPILKAGPIDAMASKLGIAPPEMIFGDNVVAIEHKSSGWGINFNAFDALDRVDKSGETMLKVAYSREWQKSRWISLIRIRTQIIDLVIGKPHIMVSKRLSNHLIGPTVRITKAPSLPVQSHLNCPRHRSPLNSSNSQIRYFFSMK
jgi:TIP41-like family